MISSEPSLYDLYIGYWLKRLGDIAEYRNPDAKGLNPITTLTNPES